MPNIDTLIESISQQISDPALQSTTYFSALSLKYAYNQLPLDFKTANQCNFFLIRGDRKGTADFRLGSVFS